MVRYSSIDSLRRLREVLSAALRYGTTFNEVEGYVIMGLGSKGDKVLIIKELPKAKRTSLLAARLRATGATKLGSAVCPYSVLKDVKEVKELGTQGLKIKVLSSGFKKNEVVITVPLSKRYLLIR